MDIHQLQLSFDALQDRIVLRIASQQREEVIALFTRRFVKELWPALLRRRQQQTKQHELDFSAKSMQGTSSTDDVSSATTAVSNEEPGRFDKEYDSKDLNHPLGEKPLLVSEARLENSQNNHIVLVLAERKARSINIALNANLTDIFCSMLRAAAQRADWDLSMEYEVATSENIENEKLDEFAPVPRIIH